MQYWDLNAFFDGSGTANRQRLARGKTAKKMLGHAKEPRDCLTILLIQSAGGTALDELLNIRRIFADQARYIRVITSTFSDHLV